MNIMFDQDIPHVDEDLVTFSVSTWYPKYRNVCILTEFVIIPDTVLQKFSDNSDFAEIMTDPAFEGFSKELTAAIVKVGGKAYFKDNWRAPTDAMAFSFNRLLQTETAADILSLMFYSERLSSDLSLEVKNRCGRMPLCVAIKPWMDIHPASEFRCIVIKDTLVGITPRNFPRYFQHYTKDSNHIINRVVLFYNTYMSTFHVENYTFDVYLDPTDEVRVFLWDISPLNETVKLHAFGWDEVKKVMEKDASEVRGIDPVFRFIAEDFFELGTRRPNL